MNKKLLENQFKNFEQMLTINEKRIIFIKKQLDELEKKKNTSDASLIEKEISKLIKEREDLIKIGNLNTNNKKEIKEPDEDFTEEDEKTLDKLTDTLIKVKKRLEEIDGELKNLRE